MAVEEEQQEKQGGDGPGKGTAVKAAAAAAATSVAALAAKKALSHRGSNSGNGHSASGGDVCARVVVAHALGVHRATR